MNKFIFLLLFAAVVSTFTGCASGNADAQRSRAEKAQGELGADVSRQ